MPRCSQSEPLSQSDHANSLLSMAAVAIAKLGLFGRTQMGLRLIGFFELEPAGNECPGVMQQMFVS